MDAEAATDADIQLPAPEDTVEVDKNGSGKSPVSSMAQDASVEETMETDAVIKDNPETSIEKQ